MYMNFQLCRWKGLIPQPLSCSRVKCTLYLVQQLEIEKLKNNYELSNYMATSEQLLITEGNTDDIATTEIRVKKSTSSSESPWPNVSG